jgi:hypothetical protein
MVLSKFANKSFFTRLLSGIVLVALMLDTIIPGGNILFVANLLISVVGVYELYKVLGIEKNSLGITGYIAVLAYYAVLYFDKKEYMMILMAISVVINTYNAEKFLRRVLDSAKDFDEIVICDMESTDSTLDIAREYGCKIVTFPKGEYRIVEPARTFAIQSAGSEWVLVIDADELVTPELRIAEYIIRHGQIHKYLYYFS